MPQEWLVKKNKAQGIPKEIVAQRAMHAWELRQKGWTWERIGGEIGVSSDDAHAYVTLMVNRFLKRVDRLVREYVASQLRQLDYIIDESLQAWEKSKQAHREVAKTSKPSPKAQAYFVNEQGEPVDAKGNPLTPAPPQEEMVTRVEEQTGDPRYFETAMRAMNEQRRILGIDQGKPLSRRDLQKMTEAELEAILNA